MPVSRLSMPHDCSEASIATLTKRLSELVEDSELSIEYPAPALQEAKQAIRELESRTVAHRDLTDIEFVTLDPPSSTDLDQALHIEREGSGYRVHYAIADVPLFVEPEGVLDRETRRRGCTAYLPDRRIALHPEIISEDAGSLLPDKKTPAFVWDFLLDDQARVRDVKVVRALVVSRKKLAYDEVQQSLDERKAHPQMELLSEVGGKRAILEIERGGASLSSPEQEIIVEADRVRLAWRFPEPIEDANAQLSLMTGMAAAQIMLKGGVGILRTMPPASDEAIERFRKQAAALKEPWPEDMPYGEFLRTLDWKKGRHLALLNHATALFRGAGYTAFHNGVLPEVVGQAAIAAPYAHTTAPLRRLVDRFVLHICHALTAGTPIDPRIEAVLDDVPGWMRSAQSTISAVEKKAREIVELSVLESYIGQEIEGTVLEQRETSESAVDDSNTRPVRIEVQFAEPPVSRWLDHASAAVGSKVRARVLDVDYTQNFVSFELVGTPEVDA